MSAERVRELEMEVEDKQAGVKIVEKKSMALVSCCTCVVIINYAMAVCLGYIAVRGHARV